MGCPWEEEPPSLSKMVAKFESYVIQVRRLQEKHKYRQCDLIAMDETPVCWDMISETTVDTTGKQIVSSLKSIGHERTRDGWRN